MRRSVIFAMACAVVVGVTTYPGTAPPPAAADPGDGTLKVHVIRDLNGDGAYDPAFELGVAGLPVTVTAPDGGTVNGVTGSDGTVTIGTAGLHGGKYRVDTSIPSSMSYLKPAPAGNGLSTLTAFADVSGGKNVEITQGVWNPSDYCQNNPTLITACQRDGTGTVVPPNPAARSLVSFPSPGRGPAPAPVQLASQADTGSVYGLAYHRDGKRIFSAAFAKRAALYGPGGPGGVYVTPAAGGPTTLFATVPNAGLTPHQPGVRTDAPFITVPGTQSLGDIELSEDGSTLYVVNMNNKRLYAFDATTPTAAAPTASFVIPNPGCAAASDWRPGALGVKDGVLYVGGVCSGQSTGNLADVKAAVFTFVNGAFSGGPVLTKTLNFLRGRTFQGAPQTDHWFAWTDDFTQYVGNASVGVWAHPMPLMTDIVVETNGDLVLGFRDRLGDEGGNAMPDPSGAETWETDSGGDLNRACRTATGYDWEGTGICPNNHTPGTGGANENPAVAEYYPGDYFTNAAFGNAHQETAQGAMALLPAQQRMPATVMDPFGQIQTGGVGWFDRTDGDMENAQHTNGYQITSTQTEGFGKANGLADLEAICDNAPVQIGNRVWFDTNRNGIQDGAEPAVPGVKVTLLACDTGATVAAKTTDAKGEYYFGTPDGVKPNTCYNLQFDASGAQTGGLPGAPPPTSLTWTSREAGANRCIDSDVNPATGRAQVTIGKPGSVDHCVDGGLVTPTDTIGDFVWQDTNRNGVQDAGEPGVPGVTVVLKDGTGTTTIGTAQTGPDGKYLFPSLPDGTYTVCVDQATMPPGDQFTIPSAGGDPAKDSNANPATGCSGPVTVGPGKRVDLTVDFGLVRPPSAANSLGDFVWKDLNGNGSQDAGEPGVPDVTVVLKDSSGVQIGQTTTDANGKYLFGNLPDGTYSVCFDIAHLPPAVAGYVLTKQNAGTPDKDSDADPMTGCTQPTTLGPDKRQDLSLDAGLVRPASPPNQLGDFVWQDTNGNGLQDAGEPGVNGVGVTVVNDQGQTVGRMTTDANGNYRFTGLPDGTYHVCFDIAHLPAAAEGSVLTKQNAGDDAKDSDAKPVTGCTPPTTLGPGNRVDLSLDAGLVPPDRLGDFVWKDTNGNGLQDVGEPGVPGVPVQARDSNGKVVAQTVTDANGKYLMNVPDGTYEVCFDLQHLPAALAGHQLTKPGQGSPGQGSAANPATGCTKPVTVGPAHREDLTLDAGFVAAAPPPVTAPPGTAPPVAVAPAQGVGSPQVVSSSGGQNQKLAFTGFDLILPLSIGAVVLLLGAGLVLLSRRRARRIRR